MTAVVLGVSVAVVLWDKVKWRSPKAAGLNIVSLYGSAIAARVALGKELDQVVVCMASYRAAGTDIDPTAVTTGPERLTDVTLVVGTSGPCVRKGDRFAGLCF